MKNFVTKLIFSILISSALYVLLNSKDGFDSAYWLVVVLYAFAWVLVIVMPIMLVLKKRNQLKVIPLTILGTIGAVISISLPHFTNVYLAKTSNLTLQKGQKVLFENGILTDYGLSQFYSDLLYSAVCGAIGGIILGFLLRKNKIIAESMGS